MVDKCNDLRELSLHYIYFMRSAVFLKPFDAHDSKSTEVEGAIH